MIPFGFTDEGRGILQRTSPDAASIVEDHIHRTTNRSATLFTSWTQDFQLALIMAQWFGQHTLDRQGRLIPKSNPRVAGK